MVLLDHPQRVVLDTTAPLTLERYLDQPEDARVEIVDGVMRGMVRPSKVHRRVQRLLAGFLEAKLPAGLRVEEEEVVVLQVAPPTARIPDVVVFRVGEDLSGHSNYTPAADVVLAVEVVSEGTQSADRYEKPIEYARNGIPSYWRIELDPVIVYVYRLVDGVYRDEGRFRRGDLIADPLLPWVSIEVNDLVGDYTDSL